MRKLLLSLAVPLVAALAFSACNLELSPYAAVVNGTTISQGELDSALASAAADREYLCSVTSGFQVGIPTHGVGQGTYDTAFSDFVLGYLVRAQLADDMVSAQHLTVSPSVEAAAMDQATSQYGSNVQGCTGTGTQVIDGLSSSFRQAIVSFYADLDELGAAKIGATLTPAGLAAYAESHPKETNFVCLNFIEVTSKAKAAALRDQIERGANFQSVASKNTIASTSSIACEPPSELPSAVATEVENLPTGQISQPFGFESDYLLLDVTARQAPSASQLLQIVVLQAEQEFPSLVADIDGSTSVQLDAAYGTWAHVRSSSGSPIDSPVAPPAQFVPSNSAVVAQASTPAASPTGTSPQG